jgi:hypothetical protein
MGELSATVLNELLADFEPVLALRHSDLKACINSTFEANKINFAETIVSAALYETINEYHLDDRQITLEQNYIDVLSRPMQGAPNIKQYNIMTGVDKSGNAHIWYIVDDLKNGQSDKNIIAGYIHSALSPGILEAQEKKRAEEANCEPYFKNYITIVDRFLLTGADMRLAEKLIEQDKIKPAQNSRQNKKELLKNVAILEDYFLKMANGSYQFFMQLAEVMDIHVEDRQDPPYPKYALYQ